LRHSVDILLKGESHYDEEKEIIQKQLKIERDELMVICQQHQVTSLSLSRLSDLIALVKVGCVHLCRVTGNTV